VVECGFTILFNFNASHGHVHASPQLGGVLITGFFRRLAGPIAFPFFSPLKAHEGRKKSAVHYARDFVRR